MSRSITSIMSDRSGTEYAWSHLFPDSRELVRSFLTPEELIPLRVTCRAECALRLPSEGSYWQWTEKNRRDIHLALELGLTPLPCLGCDDPVYQNLATAPVGRAWCYRFTCTPIDTLSWDQVIAHFQRRRREEKSCLTPTVLAPETWLGPLGPCLLTRENFRISVTRKRADFFECLPVNR